MKCNKYSKDERSLTKDDIGYRITALDILIKNVKREEGTKFYYFYSLYFLQITFPLQVRMKNDSK